MPGCGSLGPGCSLQHADASSAVSASSEVMMISPSRLNAGDCLIRGTHTDRKWSMETSPPALLPVASGPAQLVSCPSLHRLGVMNVNRGVVEICFRSDLSAVRG